MADDAWDAMWAEVDGPMPEVPLEGSLAEGKPSKWETASPEEILAAAAAAGGSTDVRAADNADLREAFDEKQAAEQATQREESFEDFIKAERARLRREREEAAAERAAAEAAETNPGEMAFAQLDPEQTDWGLVSGEDFEIAVESAKSGRMDRLRPSLGDELVGRLGRVMPREDEPE